MFGQVKCSIKNEMSQYGCSPPVTADKLLVIFIDSSFVEHVLLSI